MGVMHWNSFAVPDGPSGGVRGPPIGYTKVPKKTFLGHKRVLWLKSGETVWNKGGTSQGTSGVVLFNSFVGHRGSSRGIKGHTKGPMRPKTFFLAISWSGGSNLVEQCGIRVEQVPAHPWWCIGTVLWVRWAIEGAIGPGPIGSKTAKNGPLDHKWIWWLQSGGSVSIKVGIVKA